MVPILSSFQIMLLDEVPLYEQLAIAYSHSQIHWSGCDQFKSNRIWWYVFKWPHVCVLMLSDLLLWNDSNIKQSCELPIFSIIIKIKKGTDSPPPLTRLSIKHLSLCTDTDKNGFSFILVNHEESAKHAQLLKKRINFF